MRTTVLILAIQMLFVFAAAADDGYRATGFHRDAASLSALDSKQLRIVRRATSLCQATDSTTPGLLAHPGKSPCVISAVEHAVQDSDDPELQAYSAALPLSARYDRYRPDYYWQRMIEQ
jgi:hypothetical protein